MKKKVSKKRAPTALGHDPLAWIDSEENIEEAEVQLDEVLSDTEENLSAKASTEQEIEEPEEKAAEQQDASVAEDGASDEVEPLPEDEPENESGPQTLSLEESLGIAQVEGFHKTLLSTLNSGHEVEIDAAGVQQIDAAGVQLLYAFVHDARGRGLSVSWKSTSEALEKSAEQLGLTEKLGL